MQETFQESILLLLGNTLYWTALGKLMQGTHVFRGIWIIAKLPKNLKSAGYGVFRCLFLVECFNGQSFYQYCWHGLSLQVYASETKSKQILTRVAIMGCIQQHTDCGTFAGNM
jgi:hypothetical protein